MTYTYTLEGTTYDIVLTGELSDYADITYGQENTFEFYLKDDLETDGTTGLNYSFNYSANYGGTNLLDAESRYQILKEYQKYAGYTEVSETLGDVFYHVTTDFSRSDIDSLAVKITPGESIDEARGVWGVITSINDTTEIFGAIARVDVTVAVLADAVEFDSHSAVSTEFETNL